MLKKKREGNVMVVAALILIILPSILILSQMGGSSAKVISGNINYHQELLIEDSLKIISKDVVKMQLEEINDLEVDRDVITLDGIDIYGNYYVVANTDIDISGVKEKFETRNALLDNFGITELILSDLVYDAHLTTYSNKTTPFEHNLNIKYMLNFNRNSKEYAYQIVLNTVFDVNTDTIMEKGYIYDVEITDITILNMNE